ncbi:MAG: GTPase HflX [Hydrotalea flava]|uniref:GTPase HflX n=1 Tax=Hydrotalea TaxID=1004300 RepID=UPI000943E9AC|nr:MULTISPECIES: GTPase HflX [Hydrotalea]NIM35270.1 GTPase HflX [Hydrotalea flava]NIM38129.1 GTPase HflX [Hydrotalea flava]NIN03293.1 GTPase HflX [Hydrotalea flava]NIN14987.1 GTPase HflX [Hydrotalea flava]NIO94055.1 GTPase HflX [Hydrotalea flava]
MIDKNQKIATEEKVVLIGLVTKENTPEQIEEYLDELAFLAETAGAITLKRFVQRLPHPDSRTFLGKGKLEEIKAYVQAKGVNLAIVDDELSGSQISNMEDVLGIRTIDRSDLILDIFARRARTAQAKVQVELAQYQYLLPRLKGMWKHLERQGGGIGTRGPGETEIETDRRIVKDKIALLRKRLQEIDKQAFTQRKERGELIRVSLVGYTNVGKSTIMNLLSKSEVFAENKLFATLDTTTRKVVFENTPFLLSDTVGFIRKLPHHLVESFKSTLDEVREADILLHVVDISHPGFEEQMGTVQKTLQELKAFDKPILTIFNKMDLYESKYFDEWLAPEVKEDILRELYDKWAHLTEGNCVFIAALEKRNVDLLRTEILDKVRRMYRVRYPYKTIHF